MNTIIVIFVDEQNVFFFFGGGGGGGRVSTIKLFIIRMNSPALDYTDEMFAIQIMMDFCIAGH